MPQLKEISTITTNQISTKDLSENGDLKFAQAQKRVIQFFLSLLAHS